MSNRHAEGYDYTKQKILEAAEDGKLTELVYVELYSDDAERLKRLLESEGYEISMEPSGERQYKLWIKW